MAKSLQKGLKAKKKSRLVPRREPGIPDDSDAPYWKGQRAEHVVAARHIQYREDDEQKALRRRSKRASGGSTTGRERKPRSASQQLRRLERALARRKTLAARQRIEQQIKALKAELG